MSGLNRTGKSDLGNYPEHALIREADGLRVDEKVLLFTIASHRGGVSFATVDTLRRWTGLSRNRYYKARRQLLEKGLLSEEGNRGGATTYRLRKRPLQALARQGVARRQLARQQPSVATAKAPIVGMPATGTTSADDGHGESAHSGEASHPRAGDKKTNEKPNIEVIKNMKVRRVRPPRRTRSGEPDTAALAARTASVRARITKHREQWRDE